LRQSFDRAGYPLLTNMMAPVGLIEVYPHPALVELVGASIRLPLQSVEGPKLLAGRHPDPASCRPVSTME
jgi:hypothetical protein